MAPRKPLLVLLLLVCFALPVESADFQSRTRVQRKQSRTDSMALTSLQQFKQIASSMWLYNDLVGRTTREVFSLSEFDDLASRFYAGLGCSYVKFTTNSDRLVTREELRLSLGRCLCGAVRRHLTNVIWSHFSYDILDAERDELYDKLEAKAKRYSVVARYRIGLFAGVGLLKQYDEIADRCFFQDLKSIAGPTFKPSSRAPPQPAIATPPTPTADNPATLKPAASISQRESSPSTPASDQSRRIGIGRVLIGVWMLLLLVGVAVATARMYHQGHNIFSGWLPLQDLDQLQHGDDEEALDRLAPRTPTVIPAPSSTDTDTVGLPGAVIAGSGSIVEPNVDTVASLVDDTMVEPSPQSRLNHPD